MGDISFSKKRYLAKWDELLKRMNNSEMEATNEWILVVRVLLSWNMVDVLSIYYFYGLKFEKK